MSFPKEVLTIIDHLLYVDWQNPFRKITPVLKYKHTTIMEEY